jgi:hypothetical protein
MNTGRRRGGIGKVNRKERRRGIGRRKRRRRRGIGNVNMKKGRENREGEKEGGDEK